MTPGPTAGTDAESNHAVRLLSFPEQLFNAAEWHWRALLREYLLRGMAAHDQPYDMDEISRAGVALDAISAAAASVGVTDVRSDRTDLIVTTDLSSAADFATLQGVLDDAVRLTRLEELLQLSPLPEVIALRNWICDEVTGQAVGAEPTPWELPTEVQPSLGVAAEWDRAIAPPESVAWLVGDDQNRIVGASSTALELLEWSADELIGQRLLVVIPTSLRERHVAGFTRSVLLSEDGLLGQPLHVPALTRTGREVPIALILVRHPAPGGRTVYLATLERRAAG